MQAPLASADCRRDPGNKRVTGGFAKARGTSAATSTTAPAPGARPEEPRAARRTHLGRGGASPVTPSTSAAGKSGEGPGKLRKRVPAGPEGKQRRRACDLQARRERCLDLVAPALDLIAQYREAEVAFGYERTRALEPPRGCRGSGKGSVPLLHLPEMHETCQKRERPAVSRAFGKQ